MKSNLKESLHKISCHGSEARTLGVLRQTLGYEDDDSMDVHTWFFSSDKDYENAQRKLDDYEHSHKVDLDYMAESKNSRKILNERFGTSLWHTSGKNKYGEDVANSDDFEFNKNLYDKMLKYAKKCITPYWKLLKNIEPSAHLEISDKPSYNETDIGYNPNVYLKVGFFRVAFKDVFYNNSKWMNKAADILQANKDKLNISSIHIKRYTNTKNVSLIDIDSSSGPNICIYREYDMDGYYINIDILDSPKEFEYKESKMSEKYGQCDLLYCYDGFKIGRGGRPLKSNKYGLKCESIDNVYQDLMYYLKQDGSKVYRQFRVNVRPCKIGDILENSISAEQFIKRYEDGVYLDESQRQNRFEIEPVYPINFRESSRTTHYRTSQGNRSDTFDDYPNGISRYTSIRDWEPEPVTSWNFPKLFDSDSEIEDWDDSLRKDYYKKYYDDAVDFITKNGDAWNQERDKRAEFEDTYKKEVSHMRLEATNTPEYQAMSSEYRKASKYRKYAFEHGWTSTAKRQKDICDKLDKKMSDYVDNYVKEHMDAEKTNSYNNYVDQYRTEFDSIRNKHKKEYDTERQSRLDSFASAAEGKELFTGRDIDTMNRHFYYRNGNKYRQIGNRSYLNQPWGSNRGWRRYLVKPDATREFDDVTEDKIMSLEPVKDWNTSYLDHEVDSTD